MPSMMVCPEAPAAAVGGEILARGGNAADAAVAAAFAQGVANPFLCGLSGTAILLHMTKAGNATVLNGECAIGSLPAPEAWTECLRGRSESIGRFIIDGEDNQIGPLSVMVPGFVEACWQLHARFGGGRLSWAELIEPSIRLAADGFAVYPYIAKAWEDAPGGSRPGYPSLHDKLTRDPVAAAIYLKPSGAPFAAGETLRQPLYAATLDQLARAGARDFYDGAIGRAMAGDLAQRGGLVRIEDFATYHALEQNALCASYRGREIWTTPPPSPGVQVLAMLGILERLDVGSWQESIVSTLDVIAAVMRAGFVDNRDLKAVLLSEADEWAKRMTEPGRLDAWAARIEAGERIDGTAEQHGVGTTHLVVVDDDGDIVSFTHSIGSIAGSGTVTPELGFLYNNFLGHFDPRPGRGMSITPGRRIGSGMPTVVRRDGRIELVAGAPGGSRIITSILQVLLHVIDHGQPIDVAVAQPRFHSEEALLVHLEPTWDGAVRAALEERGCAVQWNCSQACVQAIQIGADGTLIPGLDPRGGALGAVPTRGADGLFENDGPRGRGGP